jgi:NSS family neurotransmitter:Na+ symporter
MSGPPLIFITLPKIFNSMPGGQVFAIIFWLAIFFAAASSIVNLFETPVEMLQSKFHLPRWASVLITVVAAAIVGVFMESGDAVGSWMDIMSIYICPIGALIAAVLFFWVLGKDLAKAEIQTGRTKKLGGYWIPAGKYLYCAIALLVIVLCLIFSGKGGI